MQNNFHTNCILCNHSVLLDLPIYSKDYLTKCNVCNFIFSKKIFPKETIENTYKKYHRNEQLSAITIKRYHQILNTFEKYRKTNRLLDIGCGVGYFLEEAKKRGWEVYGTEISDTAIEICKSKGIAMIKGNIDSDFADKNFDIITLFEVIEHFENPNIELKKIIPFLRKEGIIYITTPNFNSLSRYILKKNWVAGLGAPEHLSYFTPKTLNFLFGLNKLKPLVIQTTGISLSALKGKIKKSSQKEIQPKSDDEKLRTNIENSIFLKIIKALLNFLLNITSKGDTIKATFIKK